MFNQYPYVNENDLNLDYILKKVHEIGDIVKNFVNLETIKFADPITWNIATQYAKGTIVLNAGGNAYVSKNVVPAGVQLDNSDYWLEIFNFADYVRTANENLTLHVEQNTTRATAQYNVDDWLLLDDVLYKVIDTISIDDLFVVNTNIERFTVEEFCRNWVTYATNLINQYKNDIDASELAYVSAMQAEVDRILAGATVDSEVIDARNGFDGILYTTLGNAIRKQIAALHFLDPDPLNVEFTAASQTITSTFYVEAGKSYFLFTDENYTGFLNIYVDGDSGNTIRQYSAIRNKFVPAISGVLRVYNGNSNFVGPIEISVSTENIDGVLHRYPTVITTSAQLESITNGSKSCDQFPLNTIVAVGAGNIGLVNAPSSRDLGVFITFSPSGNENGNSNAQIFISNFGIEARWKTGGTWRAWKSVASVLAPQYDNTATYKIGDYCTYQNQLWKCNTEISVAEDWTAAHWTNKLVSDELTLFNTAVRGETVMITGTTSLSAVTGGTNSVNDFPANKIVVVGSTLSEMTDAPNSRKVGTYITFSYNHATNDNGCTQLFISNYGMETRWKVAGNWTPWLSVCSVISLQYDETKTYHAGETCIYQNQLYKCIRDIASPESWTASHWTKTLVEPVTYYVGSGESYTSLTTLLIDLNGNESDKIIYIKSGTYDIFAEYLAEVSNGRLTVPPDDIAAGSYLYPYNAFIPNNTKVVGLGNVILEMSPNANDVTYGESRTWSPLNVLGNVEIENLEIRAHNCRYCIHNDDKGTYGAEKQKYKNVRCYYDYSDLDASNRRLGYNMAVGFGIPAGSKHVYDDCIFYIENAPANAAFYGHDISAGDAFIVLNNCVIHSDNYSNDKTIRLQSLNHATQAHIQTNFNNCYISGGALYTLYYTDSYQAFDVIFKNCNKVPITRTPASGGTMTDIYTTTWFNPLATPTALAPLIESDSYTP